MIVGTTLGVFCLHLFDNSVQFNFSLQEHCRAVPKHFPIHPHLFVHSQTLWSPRANSTTVSNPFFFFDNTVELSPNIFPCTPTFLSIRKRFGAHVQIRQQCRIQFFLRQHCRAPHNFLMHPKLRTTLCRILHRWVPQMIPLYCDSWHNFGCVLFALVCQ